MEVDPRGESFSLDGGAPISDTEYLETQAQNLKSDRLAVSETTGCADRMRGDVRAWSPVVSGRLSADDACALGTLHATSARARELAAFLFPRRAPFLPAPDHF